MAGAGRGATVTHYYTYTMRVRSDASLITVQFPSHQTIKRASIRTPLALPFRAHCLYAVRIFSILESHKNQSDHIYKVSDQSSRPPRQSGGRRQVNSAIEGGNIALSVPSK